MKGKSVCSLFLSVLPQDQCPGLLLTGPELGFFSAAEISSSVFNFFLAEDKNTNDRVV